MANPIVIPASSALPNGVKFATFRQETARILRNTSIHLPWNIKAGLLSSFSWRLKLSGYNKGFRAKVIGEGITGYFNTIRRNLSAGYTVNRPREIISKTSRKGRKNTEWFKTGKTPYDSVLFVPATQDSSLAKTLKQHEEMNNQGRSSRIRIVEVAGKSIKKVLAPNYPWPTSKCSDPQCFPCSSSVGPPKISCRVPGILYRIICSLCDGTNDQAVYHGESGHNAYTRGGEHLKEYRAGLTTNCMSIHSRVHHPEADRTEIHYRMEVLKVHRRPLDRQIGEALSIANSTAGIKMNKLGLSWAKLSQGWGCRLASWGLFGLRPDWAILKSISGIY